MPKVKGPNEKKNHLLGCLIDGAKEFIGSVITKDMTYEIMMQKLNGRYNDPLVMNAKLLYQLFFREEFNDPKSTQQHGDQAVGRIRA